MQIENQNDNKEINENKKNKPIIQQKQKEH